MKKTLFVTFLIIGSYLSAENHYDQHNGNIPEGTDWDYREGWRDEKEAYFKGETQPEAYRKAHPSGAGGIGYDPDPNYKPNNQQRR